MISEIIKTIVKRNIAEFKLVCFLIRDKDKYRKLKLKNRVIGHQKHIDRLLGTED